MNPSNSFNLEGISLQSANRNDLSAETVQTLDRWMATQFRSYVWLTSDKEADVDFVIAWRGSEMIARSAVVTREVLLDGLPLVIMGLAGVIVKDEYQRKGLGKLVLAESMKQVEDNTAQYCILMCNKELEPLYVQLGFRLIPGQNATFSQPDARQCEYKPEHGITMVHEKNGAVWPGGVLDLNGLPF
jgi:predicted N-acetyltransferase YhbS